MSEKWIYTTHNGREYKYKDLPTERTSWPEKETIVGKRLFEEVTGPELRFLQINRQWEEEYREVYATIGEIEKKFRSDWDSKREDFLKEDHELLLWMYKNEKRWPWSV